MATSSSHQVNRLMMTLVISESTLLHNFLDARGGRAQTIRNLIVGHTIFIFNAFRVRPKGFPILSSSLKSSLKASCVSLASC